MQVVRIYIRYGRSFWLIVFFASPQDDVPTPYFRVVLVPYYEVRRDRCESVADLLPKVEALERNLGRGVLPKLTTKATEQTLTVDPAGVLLWFEWDPIPMGRIYGLIDLVDKPVSSWYKGNDLFKKLKHALPHASISAMDTPQAMNGLENNWYHIGFEWPAEHFTWGQARKAQALVRRLIEPQVLQTQKAV